MYNAVGQLCALVILFYFLKKILNKFRTITEHSALTMTFFGDFTENEYHQKLNKLAQILKFQSKWNPHHPLQQK